MLSPTEEFANKRREKKREKKYLWRRYKTRNLWSFRGILLSYASYRLRVEDTNVQGFPLEKRCF